MDRISETKAANPHGCETHETEACRYCGRPTTDPGRVCVLCFENHEDFVAWTRGEVNPDVCDACGAEFDRKTNAPRHVLGCRFGSPAGIGFEYEGAL